MDAKRTNTLVFWEIKRALFSCYLSFEIRPFALSPTILRYRRSYGHYNEKPGRRNKYRKRR